MPRTDQSSHPARKAQPNTTARKRIQQRKPAMQRRVQQDDSMFKHGSQCKHISTCWRHASSSPKLHCTGPPPCVHHFWIMNAVPGSTKHCKPTVILTAPLPCCSPQRSQRPVGEFVCKLTAKYFTKLGASKSLVVCSRVRTNFVSSKGANLIR